ncbi:MAG TPA: hypothetical protein VFU46_04585 [Gemmatimonadales bacterium]|nr:hypothetical protein [Gemmatimonadales bacterium]
MRVAKIVLALVVLAGPLAGQAKRPSAANAGPDRAVADAGAFPKGWIARTDTRGKEPEVRFEVMEPGWHITLGPAALLWRPADKVEGPFTVSTLLSQTRAPRHAEGYGIFVGGQSLESDAQQKYTYFLIRGDGRYLIKRREGANTSNITGGWTAHPGIVKAGASGEATNRLELTVNRNRLVFRVNGKEVYSADPRLIDARGVAGLRVNHNLDVHVQNFEVRREQ